MDLSRANSEPVIWLIDFHNQFNRNIKITFGSLAKLDGDAVGAADVVELPTGGEPWGTATKWRDLDRRVKDVASFIAELGLVRAASAFEDYLTATQAELDRCGGDVACGEADTSLTRLIGRLGVDMPAIADMKEMVDFFDVARNCVVHRSNRASGQLAEIRQSAEFAAVLVRWPRRIAKWHVSVPNVENGTIVEWRPRHAIMASDAYYRLGVALDRALVDRLGEAGLVNMAAHWCLLAEALAPCQAKINPETMVRSQLMTRYRVRGVELGEVVQHLRQSGRWKNVRAAYARKYPPDAPARPRIGRRRRGRK